MKLCTIDNCPNPLRARGMCTKHWSRWQRHGDPHYVQTDEERARRALQRFWSKVDKTEACWNWTAATIRGYGAFRQDSASLVYAHRFAYESEVGPIPAGLTIDHLCKNPLCVNPGHLEPVTAGENGRRASQIGYFNGPKTCRRGHDWSLFPPLLAHRSDGRVTRTCSACAAERVAS